MEKLWGKAKAILKDKLQEKNYYSWIEPVQYKGSGKNRIILETPNNFYRGWFINNYLAQVETILADLTQKELLVAVEISESGLKGQMDFGSKILGAKDRPEKKRHIQKGRPAKLPVAVLNPKYNFNNSFLCIFNF